LPVARAPFGGGERLDDAILREAFSGAPASNEFLAAPGISRATSLSTGFMRWSRQRNFRAQKRDAEPDHHVDTGGEKRPGSLSVLIRVADLGDIWMAGEQGPPLTPDASHLRSRHDAIDVCAHWLRRE